MSHLIPAYYGVTALREVMLAGAGLGDIAGHMVVLAAFDAVLLPASLWTMSRALRFARIAGTLGNR
jgi:hypothetical protein